MNIHAYIKEQLPLYAAGQLEPAQRAIIEDHLIECAACRTDLELWKTVSGEIVAADRLLVAPPELVDRAVEKIHTPNQLALAFRRAWVLILAQASLIRPEMWPASGLVMAMGAIVALTLGRADIIYFLAPMVAASSLAILYGPEHDPALELTRATPTSPWKILLARLSVVSSYNLALSLAATLILLFFIPLKLLGVVILGWLGPLAFLSALALLLSLWLGTNNAIAISYGLWMVQYIPFKMLGQWMASPVWSTFQGAYQDFWHSPLILLMLSILLIGIALWSANRSGLRLNLSGF